jgi:oxygen-independent coproporphyrinogen-3 oxidase
MRISPRQALIREMILQLKRGYLSRTYFADKFGVDVVDQWRAVWDEYVDEGWATVEPSRINLTRAGLLRVDALLPGFFEPEFRDVRYT